MPTIDATIIFVGHKTVETIVEKQSADIFVWFLGFIALGIFIAYFGVVRPKRVAAMDAKTKDLDAIYDYDAEIEAAALTQDVKDDGTRAILRKRLIKPISQGVVRVTDAVRERIAKKHKKLNKEGEAHE